jgi:hypothetical protein
MAHFQQEMIELRGRMKNSGVVVGSPTELQHLRKHTEDMANFCSQIKATTKVGQLE